MNDYARQAEIDEAARVRALYPAIAAAMSELDPSTTWTADPTAHDSPTSTNGCIDASDGRRVLAYPTPGPLIPLRLEWCGVYPRLKDGTHMPTRHGMAWPVITTSTARAPKSIAVDIVRRLLPAYTTAFHQLERQAE